MAMGRQRITPTQNTEEMSRKMTVTYSARLSKAESWECAEFAYFRVSIAISGVFFSKHSQGCYVSP